MKQKEVEMTSRICHERLRKNNRLMKAAGPDVSFERLPHHRSSTAAAERRHPSDGSGIYGAIFQEIGETDYVDPEGDDGGAAGLSVARERPGVGKHYRAGRDLVPGAGLAAGGQTGSFIPPTFLRRENPGRDGAKPDPENSFRNPVAHRGKGRGGSDPGPPSEHFESENAETRRPSP